MKIQYSVTILGSMEVPDDVNYEEIKSLIADDYWQNEPNDIEWEATND